MVSEMDDMRAYEAMFKGMRQNPNPEAHTPTVKKVVQEGEAKKESTTREETV